ncbi:MAG: type I restriction-modification system subunit M [Prevotella sp.]|nr:type I restriction-modification system subunit M [Prevotella sp.]
MSKEQERAELHRTIWQIANDLRGSVDGWDFKNYVLGFLFYRFISEDLTAHLNREEAEAGNSDFDYASDVADDDIDDDIRRQTIDEKGFFIYPSELFKNVVARAEDDDNLNETLSRIFKNIEGSAIGTDSESDMKGLFSDIDVNSPKLGATVTKRNELLTKIMQKIGAMDLGGDLQDAKIDAFGDAYEFLMTMYASNAGKSGGEFFTPQEVAELLARIACDGKDKINKVYDPACGSGSLLLKFVKVLGAEKAKQVSFYGQEVNITTYNLCRINMFLHHVPFNMFDIQLGDTLTEPKHMAEIPFDAIVSNPPYSTRWAGDANPLLINDDRYSPAGVLAPKTKADLAFTMHMLHHLSTTGTAAIVEFPGVLYRGGAEQKIRQYLIENNYVDTVIQLPSNLFFGVGIATCIIVLKKSKADNSVLFIDASEEYVKDGNKNKLTDDNIQAVFSYYADRKDVEYKAKLVNCKDILANDCNLSVSSYVEQEDKREAIDIKTVNATLSELIAEGNSLNAKIDSIIKEIGG